MSIRKKGAKLFVILLAILQTAQIMAGAFSDNTTFSDVSSDAWYAQDVATCAKFEIVKGFGDGAFKPEKSLTRGEFMLHLVGSLYKRCSFTFAILSENILSALEIIKRHPFCYPV